MKGTLVLLLGMIGSLVAASDLPRLRVEGDPILAGEKKIRLRGINRGVVEQQGNPLHGREYEAALRAGRQCPASERQPIRGQWLFRLRKKTAAVIRSISLC